MSHRTEVKTQFLDKELVKQTCEQLGHEFVDEKNLRMFDGATESEYAIKLKGWSQPVCVKQDGGAWVDNYEGRWGEMATFNQFCQRYAENVTMSHAERNGYRVLHREEVNGTIQLRLGR